MDDMGKFGMMSGAGGIGAGLGAMFADWDNPADAAMPYFEQMKKMLPKYYQPFIDAGTGALPGMQDAYKRMMDPNAFIKQIGAGYQESPGFQFQKNQAMSAAQNAAAAGGMLGTPQHEQQSASLVNNLANQDFYNYLSRALGTYDRGLGGLEGLYDKGANASMGLGDSLASILRGQAGLAYKGQQAENDREGSMWGNLIGGAGQLAGAMAFM